MQICIYCKIAKVNFVSPHFYSKLLTFFLETGTPEGGKPGVIKPDETKYLFWKVTKASTDCLAQCGKGGKCNFCDPNGYGYCCSIAMKNQNNNGDCNQNQLSVLINHYNDTKKTNHICVISKK